jgi:2'-5' RNA ligase
VTGVGRAFLAIVPPPEVLDAVEALLDRGVAAKRFKWTRRDQWHVTIQFYGRVADVEALTAALADACATRPPVRLQLRGGGAFPKPKRAEVYWLGIDDGDALATLHEVVIDATAAFVARRDRVSFHPHLTLARLTSRFDLTEDVDALERVPVGTPWTARELTLLASETRREGALYTELARIPLGGVPPTLPG